MRETQTPPAAVTADAQWDGVPMHPERAGWHAFVGDTGNVSGIDLRYYWIPIGTWLLPDDDTIMWCSSAAEAAGRWTQDPGKENPYVFNDFENEGVLNVRYLGPCLTPSEVVALRASNAEMLAALEAIRYLPLEGPDDMTQATAWIGAAMKARKAIANAEASR